MPKISSFTEVKTIDDLLVYAKGVTKKEIAIALDKAIVTFNFSAESGLTSYKNYTKFDLLVNCLAYKIDPINR